MGPTMHQEDSVGTLFASFVPSHISIVGPTMPLRTTRLVSEERCGPKAAGRWLHDLDPIAAW